MRCFLNSILVLQCSFDNDYRFVPGCSRGNLVPASDEEGQLVSLAKSEFAEAAADGAWQINKSVYKPYEVIIKTCGSKSKDIPVAPKTRKCIFTHTAQTSAVCQNQCQ